MTGLQAMVYWNYFLQLPITAVDISKKRWEVIPIDHVILLTNLQKMLGRVNNHICSEEITEPLYTSTDI